MFIYDNRKGVFYPFDYRFLLFRYSVINILLVVLYRRFGAKIFEFLNRGAKMVGNKIVKRCEYEN
ncbi:hypothetical protein VK90_27275 [Bacillus sp. LK2]|nr:hypothetical protein VK90_27275 [Bacillus sp. LK2]